KDELLKASLLKASLLRLILSQFLFVDSRSSHGLDIRFLTAPGTDLQLPLAHGHPRQLPFKATESRIPSTYEKKSLHVLRVPPLQYCPVPTQPQPVPREKLLPPQLLHETPMPTPRTEIRPTLLHQDQAGSPHVKITAGSDYKLESAPVDKDVSSPVNSTFAEFRH
ncbi:hypothetical protein E4U14_001081, partial [Claviceps sp. LM454 group G7]